MARLDYGISDIVEAPAAAGGADALFQLGLMYSAGREVEQDLVIAHKWFNLAALRGNEEAKIYRMEIARELTRQEVSRAQRMAREWLRMN
jgi:uncharacterized protein